MNQSLYKHLQKVAAAGQTISYKDLAKKTGYSGPRDKKLHEDLGECSEQSLQQNRFLLSSVVVHKSGQMGPGEGFYWLARHLGLKVGKSMFNKTRFFQHQLDLVYVYYYKGNLPAPL
jgi:hypothetical protein